MTIDPVPLDPDPVDTSPEEGGGGTAGSVGAGAGALEGGAAQAAAIAGVGLVIANAVNGFFSWVDKLIDSFLNTSLYGASALLGLFMLVQGLRVMVGHPLTLPKMTFKGAERVAAL